MRLNRVYFQSHVLAIAIVCFILVYFESIKMLVATWKLDWNSHGFLLLPLCVYIFFKLWSKHKNQLVISLSGTGIFILFGLSFAWLLSKLVFVEYVEFVSLPLIFTAILISIYGWNQSRVLWFPVLLMLLGSPFLGLMIPTLQNITAQGTGLVLDLIGLTNMVDGVLIFVPAGTFLVDSGCSGLNVVTVGVILSLLYAYINKYKIIDSIILLLLGILVAVLSNIIRVVVIVIVGNETKMQHSLVTDHVHLGWIVFLIVFSGFVFAVNRYYPSCKVEKDSDSKQNMPADLRGSISNKHTLFGLLLVLAGVAVGPGALSMTALASKSNSGIENITLSTSEEWRIAALDSLKWRPVYKTGSGNYEVFNKYINTKQDAVYLDLRYYFRQSAKTEVTSGENRVYASDSWALVWSKLVNTDDGSSVEETLLRDKGGQELLVWRWYSINDYKTGDMLKVKVYNLIGVLTGKPAVTAFIVATKANQSYSQSRILLQQFSKSIRFGVTL